MRRFAQQRPLLAYYLLALAIACAVMVYTVLMLVLRPATATALDALGRNITDGPWYINIATIAEEVAKAPVLAGIFVFAAAPSIAALVIAGLGGGGGLRQLLGRLNPIGPDRPARDAILLYAALLGVYALGFAVYDFVAGPGVDPYGRLRAIGGGAALGALAGLFLDEGGSLEELGWRGFAGPELQRRHLPLVGAIILGVMHWAWHLPREVLTLMGGVDIAVFALNQTVFVILCIALSIVAMFACNRAGGSVWPAVFVHGGTNVWSKAVGEFASPSFGVLDLRTLLLIVIAIVVAIAAGGQLGRARHR